METWMSKLSEDKLLILTNIPGTHDSSAFNINCFGSCFAKTQELDYQSQLNIGIRNFDIRVTKKSCYNWFCYNQLKDELFDEDLLTCHGICDCYHNSNTFLSRKLTFREVLEIMKDFLEKNKSEGIIINVQSGRGDEKINMSRALTIFEKVCGNISVIFDKKLKIKDIRGKIICCPNFKKGEIDRSLLGYNTIEGGYDLEEINKKYVNYSSFKVSGILKVREIKEMLDRYEITFKEAEEKKKENAYNFPFHYSAACTGEYEKILPFPKKEANIVNNFFLLREIKKGFYYGWIIFDFINEEIAKKIIESNF